LTWPVHDGDVAQDIVGRWRRMLLSLARVFRG